MGVIDSAAEAERQASGVIHVCRTWALRRLVALKWLSGFGSLFLLLLFGL